MIHTLPIRRQASTRNFIVRIGDTRNSQDSTSILKYDSFAFPLKCDGLVVSHRPLYSLPSSLLAQETQKRVPSASGSNYGHWNHWARPPSERGPVRYVFDSPDRAFAMRNNIEAEFYRRNKPFPGTKDTELH